MIKNFLYTRLMLINTFLPLVAFVWAYRFWGDWQIAFSVGGVLSLVYIAQLLYSKQAAEAFIVAIHCFLIGGAAMFLFNICWLQTMYDDFLYATLFCWVFFVGFVQTVFSRGGFVGLSHAPKACVTKASVLLLGATLGAFFFSWQIQSSVFVSGVLPFIFLTLLRNFLQKKYQ